MNFESFQVVVKPSKLERQQKSRLSDQDKILLEVFELVAGADFVIEAEELQDLLQRCFRRELQHDGRQTFNMDTCRSMIQLYDQDRSGCIEFDEFRRLWANVKVWHSVFRKYDKDRSNDMNTRELGGALKAIDDARELNLAPKSLARLVRRFANKSGGIDIDDFFQIVCRIKFLTESFERRWSQSGNTGKQRKAKFTLDDFIEATLLS